MSYVIAAPCIGVKDTACVTVCPVDCIHPTLVEVDFPKVDQLFIDPTVCVNCDLCVDECPVRAIFAKDDLPIEWNEFVEKNAEYFE